MRYELIAFDLDGTLIDSEEAVLRSLQDTLLTVTGKHYPTEELTFSLGITGADCMTRLDVPDPEGALRLWEDKLRAYDGLVHLFPGVPGLMRELTALGVKLGVVTSKTLKELNDDFIPLGLGPYFSTVITASDTVEHKPHPAPLRKCMELAGAAPETTLYVGDSPYDGQCAHAAGADFALAMWGCRGRLVPAEHMPQTPMDLLALV